MGWGAGDFLGGYGSRRASLFGVSIGMQVVSLALGVTFGLVAGEAPLGGADLAWCVATGLFGVGGMTLLYHALSTGQMGIVAPVSGVLSAAIPVVVGGLLEGFPGWVRAAGIALGILAVLVVSRSSDGTPTRRGVILGIVAGIGFGCYAVSIAQVSDGHVWFPLAVARGTALAVLVAVVLLARREWRVGRGTILIPVIAGIADALGNAAFLLGAQAGRLDVVALLSSLYPVTTVLLAAIVLRERVDRSHAGGIVLAFGAIALIAGG